MAGPDISIIVPCYNEERHIAELLNAICMQTMPTECMEVVVADGMSTDDTRIIINDFAQKHEKLAIKLVDNPKRNIPSALNLAINAAHGTYIVRLDAHSIPAETYVSTCVKHLKAETAQNVGGVWLIEPNDQTTMAKAIAYAASHPLGVGGAQYRDPNTPAGFVDTVPFGSYRKDYLMKIGLYNEALLTNEDYELNTRIRKNGGKIFLDPKIQCTYFARENLHALSKQYYRYGFWKFRMLKQYPESLRLRQLLPPLFVFGLILLLALCLIFPILLFGFFLILTLYIASIFIGTFLVSNKVKTNLWLHLLTTSAIITMHFSWGIGFLISPIKGFFR